MDPEQVDRPGRHVEPAEPETPDEQNLADYELKLDGHQSTEVSSPAEVAESEDPAVRDHSGPPLQNLEGEGSDDVAVFQLEPDVEESDEEAVVQLEPDEVESSGDEADVVQLEPAEVENSGDEADVVQLEPAQVEISDNEADVGQLEPAGVAGSAEVIVVQQVSTDEESSRAFSMEEEPHADVDGAEEPGPLVENVLWVPLRAGVDLREPAEAVGERVAAGQAAIANMRHDAHALEAAAVNLREAVGERQRVAAVQAAIANLLQSVHALEVASVNLRDVIVGEGGRVAALQAAITNLRRHVHALEAVDVYFRDVIVAMEAGFGIGADDTQAADPA